MAGIDKGIGVFYSRFSNGNHLSEAHGHFVQQAQSSK
jgi:hypothetical protein